MSVTNTDEIEVTSLVLAYKVISKLNKMYLLFFLTIKELVINSLRPVGKFGPPDPSG